MSILTRRASTAALAAAACLLAPAAASADPVAEFYKANPLRVMVGFGAGGANDIWARTIARHMVLHLPGSPSAIVQAMPGAGSLRLTNYLYNVAPRDGTTFGIVSRGIAFEGIFKGKGVEYDALRLTYIGSPAQETTVCAVTTAHPHKTIKDFFEHEVAVGTGGGGSETNLTPLTLRNVLGMKFNIVAGYKSGGTDVALAIERDELDGICIGYSTLSNLPLYKRGGFRSIFKISILPDPNPQLKDIPNIFDAPMTEEQRALLDLTFARAALGRPFIGPPDIPAERVTALRKAFDATMSDPAFVEEATRAGLEVTPTSGDVLEGFVRETHARTTPEIAAKGAQALGR